MAKVIGIDLGTTHSLIGAYTADGPVLFPNALGRLLTPSAVSHQVKALERALGVTLFRRQGRAVVLTEAGEDPIARDVMAEMDGLIDLVDDEAVLV